MLSTCIISGIQFPTPEFSWIRTAKATHPIFSLPVDTLLSQALKYSSGRMTTDEKKLLFLALLKSTNLVEFKASADISIELIEKNMELVFHLVQWKCNSLAPSLGLYKLPRYVVSYPSTHKMDNIRAYLDTWSNIHHSAQMQRLDNYMNRMSPEERSAKEEKLKKLLWNGIAKARNYELTLATWAMSATGYTINHPNYDHFISLFQLKEPELYKEKHTANLQELLETMEEKLEAYNKHADRIAKAVLVHIRNLLTINSKGPAALYGLADISFSSAPEYVLKLKEDIQDAPIEKPIEINYPNKMSYIIAKTKWTKAQEYYKLESEHTNKLKEQFREKLLDDSFAQEDGAMDDDEDEITSAIVSIPDEEI